MASSTKKGPIVAYRERESLLPRESYQNSVPTNFGTYSQLNGPTSKNNNNNGQKRRAAFPGINIYQNYSRPIPIKWTKTLNNTACLFTTILLIVFIMLIVFKVWNVANYTIHAPQLDEHLITRTPINSNVYESSELVLINVLFRHGDRAPENIEHLGMQQLEPEIHNIWPNGLGNLTDIGQMRMFKVGLELSKLYRIPLGPPSPKTILALSSDYSRCIQSMRVLLRGLYSGYNSLGAGLELTSAHQQCLIGSSEQHVCKMLIDMRAITPPLTSIKPHVKPVEWKTVQIDHSTMPGLRSNYVVLNCPRYSTSSCKIHKNIYNDDRITSLPGIRELEKNIALPYQDAFNYDLSKFFGSLGPIINVASIAEVRKALLPHINWLTKPVKQETTNSHRNMSLYNMYEALNQLADISCLERGDSGLLQIGPVVSSIIDSQQTALDLANNDFNSSSVKLNPNLNGRKMILYSTHDVIIEMLLRHLGIRRNIEDGESYAKTFLNSPQNGNQLEAFLSGIKRAQPGGTTVFELWNAKAGTRLDSTTSSVMSNMERQSFGYVRVLIYQRENTVDDKVSFERVNMGAICRNIFEKSHGKSDLHSFYANAPEFFDREHDCPFELWKNITRNKMMSPDRFDELCLSN